MSTLSRIRSRAGIVVGMGPAPLVQGLYLTYYHVRFNSDNALERNTSYFYTTVISASLPTTCVYLMLLPWVNPKIASSILLSPKFLLLEEGKQFHTTSNVPLQRTTVETTIKGVEFVCPSDLNVILKKKRKRYILFAVRIIMNACLDT